MKNNKQLATCLWRSVLACLFLCTVIFSFTGCLKKDPIRVGFVADLTGKQAELGVQERNGVQLAIEKYNLSLSITGRPIELIIRDDTGDPEVAKAVDQGLIDAGVVAIIGHATSAQTVAGLQITNAAHVVMLSPSVSSPALSGKYEYFLRVYPTFLNSAQGFAKHIYDNRKLPKLAIFFDTDNAAYALTYHSVFTNKYKDLGGIIVDNVGFSSSRAPEFSTLLTKVRDKNPDGILLITSDVDAALISQRIRLMDWRVPLFASAWAQTATLIYHGGKTVEGMELEQAYALNSENPEFLDFKKRYQSRYGQSPSFGAAFGYEAAMVLTTALEKTDGKAEGLRQSLLEIKDFKGLIDTFSFKQDGDVERPFYLSVIRNGDFIVIDSLPSKGP